MLNTHLSSSPKACIMSLWPYSGYSSSTDHTRPPLLPSMATQWAEAHQHNLEGPTVQPLHTKVHYPVVPDLFILSLDLPHIFVVLFFFHFWGNVESKLAELRISKPNAQEFLKDIFGNPALLEEGLVDADSAELDDEFLSLKEIWDGSYVGVTAWEEAWMLWMLMIKVGCMLCILTKQDNVNTLTNITWCYCLFYQQLPQPHVLVSHNMLGCVQL